MTKAVFENKFKVAAHRDKTFLQCTHLERVVVTTLKK